jgi:hypothetical protein
MESHLMQVFSAAFREFALQKDDEGNSRYENLFEKHFGERWSPPTQTFEKDNVFPTYESLIDVKSPLLKRKIVIGTYDHKPYCSRKEDGDWEGWEFDIANEVKKIIIDHYPEINKLVFEWFAAPIDEDELPMNGSDNDIIKGILVNGLENRDYDMVFSGTLLKNEQTGVQKYEFATPTSNFYVSGAYTGRDNYGEIPVGSAEEMLKYLGEKSYEKNPLRIIHTSNGGQTRIATNIGSWVKEYEGSISDWDVHVPSIFSLIEYQDPHLYVGDSIQIMYLATQKEDFPDIQFLHLDFDSFISYGTMEIIDDKISDKLAGPDPETDVSPMFIAPYALKDIYRLEE